MKSQFGTTLRLLLIVAALFGLVATSFGQEETAATVTGTISDSTGAIIPNANVSVTNTATGIERRAQANAEGVYVITTLVPGEYALVVEQQNFKRFVQNITLNARDRRSVNVALEPGSPDETVTITDEAPLIQDSPTGQGLISGTQVIELPLNNRNFLKLTELVPGISSSLDDESSFGLTSRADISINGMRRNAVNYFVDGVSNTDVGSNITLLSTPTIDSIKEFKVLTSIYTAEIGRSGGGVVTLVSKSGGNDFHGSLYDFVRNDRFNANNFFNNRLGRRPDGSPVARVPRLRYHNFGFTFSGPVSIPRFGEGGPALYQAKNKTFFFFSEEVRRITRGTATAAATVPTLPQRAGDFSANLGALLYQQANGTSGTAVTGTPLFVTNTAGAVVPAQAGMVFRADGRAYVGNIVPAGDQSALAHTLLPAYPIANSGLSSFTSTSITVNNTRQEAIRIDHNFNDNQRLMGRYTHDLSETQEPGGLFAGIVIPNIATTETRVPGHVLAISLTSIISPTLVNEATYNFSGNLIGSQVVGRGRRSDYPGSNAIPEAFPENNNNAIPTVAITGISSIGALQGFNIKYTNHVIRDVVTYTSGNHTFKFGGEISFEAKNENANNITQGSFAFNTTGSSGVSTTGVNLTQTGVGFASFLLGRAASYTEDEFDVTNNLRFGRREFFFQDTWRVRRDLTLDLGVRYQYFQPVKDKNNVMTSFFPSLYNPAAVPTCTTAACVALVRGTGNELNGIAVAGVNSPFGRAISPSDKNNFSPRVGLAWSPDVKSGFFHSLFGDAGKTVIRTGYGFYYDQVLVGIFEQNAFVNPPFNNRATFTGAGVTLANPSGGTLGALPIRALIASAEDFSTPEVQQWSLGIQRELFSRGVIDISYVGTKGDHLIRDLDLNQPHPADVLLVGTGNRNTIRPFVGYGAITYRETSAVSRYHGLLSSFNYRFSNGFSITTSYTFSKNLTDATNDRDAIDRPQNARNKRIEYAEARTSRPHIFSASYVYELPFFRNAQNPFLRHVLGGWQISGITSLASGQPVPRIVADTGNEIRGNRPNLTCDPNAGLAGTLDANGLPFVFDPTCFALPADGTFGNAPRAFARLPGQNQTNLSAVKNFYFNREKGRSLQLRAEGFNVFNHTQFTGIGATLATTTNLGRPTGTRLPREFQFAAKLYF